MGRKFFLSLYLFSFLMASCIGGDDTPFFEFPECTISPGAATNEAEDITSSSAFLSAIINRPTCIPSLRYGFYFSENEDLFGNERIVIEINDFEDLDGNRFIISTRVDQLKASTTYYFTAYVIAAGQTFVDDNPKQFTTLSE